MESTQLIIIPSKLARKISMKISTGAFLKRAAKLGGLILYLPPPLVLYLVEVSQKQLINSSKHFKIN
jgi:hypothetical protein